MPAASVFVSGDGTPLYIDMATGIGYFLNDAGAVTALSGGAGAEPSNGDKGDITVSGAGLVWTIDAGVATTPKWGRTFAMMGA